MLAVKQPRVVLQVDVKKIAGAVGAVMAGGTSELWAGAQSQFGVALEIAGITTQDAINFARNPSIDAFRDAGSTSLDAIQQKMREVRDNFPDFNPVVDRAVNELGLYAPGLGVGEGAGAKGAEVMQFIGADAADAAAAAAEELDFEVAVPAPGPGDGPANPGDAATAAAAAAAAVAAAAAASADSAASASSAGVGAAGPSSAAELAAGVFGELPADRPPIPDVPVDADAPRGRQTADRIDDFIDRIARQWRNDDKVQQNTDTNKQIKDEYFDKNSILRDIAHTVYSTEPTAYPEELERHFCNLTTGNSDQKSLHDYVSNCMQELTQKDDMKKYKAFCNDKTVNNTLAPLLKKTFLTDFKKVLLTCANYLYNTSIWSVARALFKSIVLLVLALICKKVADNWERIWNVVKALLILYIVYKSGLANKAFQLLSKKIPSIPSLSIQQEKRPEVSVVVPTRNAARICLPVHNNKQP